VTLERFSQTRDTDDICPNAVDHRFDVTRAGVRWSPLRESSASFRRRPRAGP
jgi:hypothetical protein